VSPAIGPFAIVALLLVIGGSAKALRPRNTTIALRGAGLRVGEPAVRAGGAVEAALGFVALTRAGLVIGMLVAASYAAFSAFVAIALVRHLPISSCGCFGRFDTPPTAVHLAVTSGAVVAACMAAFDSTISPLDVATRAAPESVDFVVLVVAGALAAFVALALLPRVLAATATR
jgi:hypothetical protein